MPMMGMIPMGGADPRPAPKKLDKSAMPMMGMMGMMPMGGMGAPRKNRETVQLD